MLRFPSKRTSRPTIHLTALIDIVFLLLIFFLLASSFSEQEAIVIIVPEVESDDTHGLTDIVVQLDQYSTIYFKGETVNHTELLGALGYELRRRGKDTVVIQADRRNSYDAVVQIIDVAKLAGAKFLLLVTSKKPGQ